MGNLPTSGTGHWELAGGSGTILTPNSNITKVTGLAPGTNTFKWVINDGTCSNYDEVQIINNEPTDPVVCSDTIKICTDYANLCANFPPDGETGFWFKASGSGVIASPSNPNTLVTNLSPNSTFIWKMTKGICSKYETTYISMEVCCNCISRYTLILRTTETICKQPQKVQVLDKTSGQGNMLTRYQCNYCTV
jgi:hypothetical protein